MRRGVPQDVLPPASGPYASAPVTAPVLERTLRVAPAFQARNTGNTGSGPVAAELTQAAYPVVLCHGTSGLWIDLELELWTTLACALRRTRHDSLLFPDASNDQYSTDTTHLAATS